MARLRIAAAFAALTIASCSSDGGGGDPGVITGPEKCKWNSALLASDSQCQEPPTPVLPAITRLFSQNSVDLGASLVVPYSVIGVPTPTCEVSSDDMAPGSSSNPNFVYAKVQNGTTFSPTYLAPSGWNPGRNFATLRVRCQNSVGSVDSLWVIRQTLPVVVYVNAVKGHTGGTQCVIVIQVKGATSYNGSDFNGTYLRTDLTSPGWVGTSFLSLGELGISVPDGTKTLQLSNDPAQGPQVNISMESIPGSCP